MNSITLANDSILFSHNDLDGIGCGILFKSAVGHNAEVHYCGYHNVDDKINERIDEIELRKSTRPSITVTDLGIKEETAKRLDKYGGEVHWLDHHATNIDLAENYDWAEIDTEASGTLLVFTYVEGIDEKYRPFSIHVDDYDRWVHSYPSSKELNRLFFILGINRFEERCVVRNQPERFNESEKILLELEEESIERYTDKVEKGITVYELEGDKRFGVGFAEQYQSETAHDLLHRLELDAIALIDVNRQSVSMRSIPSFDVGSIAKRLGGGGHKNAAGVGFNYGRIEDFHGSKYPLFDFAANFKTMIFELFWKVKRTHADIETEMVEQMMKTRRDWF